MQIPYHFDPRLYQINAIQALENDVTLAVLCWARRAGKDMTAFNYSIKRMVEQPMNVALVFPTKEQGKTAFWENVENDGFKTIDHIPDSLVERRDNSTMRIILKNGSTFQVLGATDPESLRGANGRIYIFSEFVDIPSSALDIIRPIVAVNKGQIIIISTPKIDGISGAVFKVLFDRAKTQPKQYASLITAEEYLTKEVLEEIRQEYIAKYGNDYLFRQEFLCDFGQVSNTSFYGSALSLCRTRGNIADYPYDPKHPVYAAWDLGMSDSTAITMFQYYKKQAYIIDYFETSNIGDGAIINFLKTKPYNFGWHFFPHDGAKRESDSITRFQKARELGLINSSLLTREAKTVGINRVVEQLPTTKFNEETTADLIRKLSMYKRQFNALTGDYMGPDHKTESHAADSVQYMFEAIDQTFNTETGEFLYSPANVQDDYEFDAIETPEAYSLW